jgi:phosphoribulokinase
LSPALQVEHHLVNFLRSDDSGAAARGTRAVLHWCNPVLAAAFATWQEAAQLQVSDRTNELKAAKFLQLALALKALTGFKWAVQEAHVDRAAAGHRGGAVKKAVLRSWRQVTWYLQVCQPGLSCHHTQQCAVAVRTKRERAAENAGTASESLCAIVCLR